MYVLIVFKKCLQEGIVPKLSENVEVREAKLKWTLIGSAKCANQNNEWSEII